MSSVLIVDDEESICWSLKRLLSREGHTVRVASSAESGLDQFAKQPSDLIMLDVRLPGIDGLTAMQKFKELSATVPIIVMTAFGDLETAVKAVRNGALEYLTKPFDLEQAARAVSAALKPPHSTSEIATDNVLAPSSADMIAAAAPGRLLGKSPAMQAVFKQIALAADSNLPVLITGESGTGKELVSRAIHEYSKRREEPYMAVALVALNPSLIESELFGHSKGAFTGATENRRGLFELASSGTLLLDEIGDLPEGQQIKLLRVLEQNEFTPVGSAQIVHTSARVIAATHRDLQAMTDQGKFRQDLYFRLCVLSIHIPPLRERLEDIIPLALHFLARLNYPDLPFSLTQDAIGELQRRPWVGNIRELRNTIDAAALAARGRPITAQHLPQIRLSRSSSINDLGATATMTELVQRWTESKLIGWDQSASRDENQLNENGLYDQFLSIVEPPLMKAVLEHCKGNRAAAANLLGMHRTTLRTRLRQHGLDDNS